MNARRTAPLRIDSHQHFWRVGAFDYPWLTPALTVLYRDYLPCDLRPQLAPAGVDKTVIVQASPTIAETEWMLELARDNDFVAGVVGWLDFESGSFAADLARLRRNPKLVGLRPAVEFIDDVRWLLRPAVMRNLGVMAGEGVPFDFIVWPRHLQTVLEVVERLPNLRCVIDHLAKPDVKGRSMEPWAGLMSRIAAHPNVRCKLSGLMTQADHERWTARDLQPYFEHVVKSFGPSRLMYGSDWPVSQLASDYATTVRVVKDALGPQAGAATSDAVFGGNAIRFYELKDV